MMNEKITLYYAHDPMCSWCWGFAPVLADLLAQLPAAVRVKRLLGGLAADSEQPMPEAMQTLLQQTWRRIEEKIPTTKFNFDFWSVCKPRRSTYPACRAVIAARQQGARYDTLMTQAIQRAYYTQARNPSDHATLISLADEIGLEVSLFTQTLQAAETQLQLQQEIALARTLYLESFPSIALHCGDAHSQLQLNYTNVKPMLEQINNFIENHCNG